MKILVGIKRVIDYNVRVQVNRDGTGVVKDGVKMSINPFDEIAVEEALRMKERGEADEVVVVSHRPGGGAAAAAHGAGDGRRPRRALPDRGRGPAVGRSARAAENRAGRRRRGWCCSASRPSTTTPTRSGQMLAALWDRPQATFVSKLERSGDALKAVREVDAGLENIEVDLPAVVTVDLRLNEPRFVKMPDIMKAKRKPLDIKPFTELGVEMPPQLEVGAHEPPPKRQGGTKVESVEALVKALKDKGVL